MAWVFRPAYVPAYEPRRAVHPGSRWQRHHGKRECGRGDGVRWRGGRFADHVEPAVLATGFAPSAGVSLMMTSTAVLATGFAPSAGVC